MSRGTHVESVEVDGERFTMRTTVRAHGLTLALCDPAGEVVCSQTWTWAEMAQVLSDIANEGPI